MHDSPSRCASPRETQCSERVEPIFCLDHVVDAYGACVVQPHSDYGERTKLASRPNGKLAFGFYPQYAGEDCEVAWAVSGASIGDCLYVGAVVDSSGQAHNVMGELKFTIWLGR